MTIRWFTDADRQDMRDAAEERQVFYELLDRYLPMHVLTPEERDEAVAHYPEHGERMSTLRIDPYRRS
ncbi:hypothetical protein [Geodermatophilus obscurus]|uniref:Uncharacterized protein n=1 Tax=Geodermatophilus obscurus (strain ATCC 25078 / DSM 43160 / JCM 3152 / CCUG 61914 / KCC A-0152 / KCTC 9177 / NBRC 13315 / NRRL B-3577 / G-20) TaxID=526225 RepID=D2SB36_GEOOG|nr:hypothetical protein [Geodermatophilus obscurus]ADB76071.1 hypothetical protein Gobs_3473 [Geodermatophilus obscurus DSM 43160]